MKLTFVEAVKRYGPIVNGKWPGEPKWMTIYKTPKWFADQVINSATGKKCQRIYMNRDMVLMLEKALELLVERGVSHELKTFDGCYQIRSIRGKVGIVSAHSYGIALDFNAKENPLNGNVTFSKEFLQCFEEAGFTLGANFARKDGMHFSLGW
jgi:hypothetical protein